MIKGNAKAYENINLIGKGQGKKYIQTDEYNTIIVA